MLKGRLAEGLDAMGNPHGKSDIQVRWIAAVTGALLLAAPVAFGQNAPVPVAPVQSAPLPEAGPPAVGSAEQAPAPRPNPGLFEAIGRWIDESGANFRSHLRGAKDRMDTMGNEPASGSRDIGNKAADVGKGAVDVTKGAVDAVVKLPATRVMRGHERCGVAPNGAPDCIVAAETLCRKHGFSSGKSVDFTAAEECSARILVTGRQENDCRTVTFISRAMCQ
jgi:hypothetical protein